LHPAHDSLFVVGRRVIAIDGIILRGADAKADIDRSIRGTDILPFEGNGELAVCTGSGSKAQRSTRSRRIDLLGNDQLLVEHGVGWIPHRVVPFSQTVAFPAG